MKKKRYPRLITLFSYCSTIPHKAWSFSLIANKNCKFIAKAYTDDQLLVYWLIDIIVSCTLDVRQYLVLSFPGKLSDTRNAPSPKILTPSSAQ